MADEKTPFVPYTTEQKKAFGQQFSKQEKLSYRKGQRNAYSHMANTARRESCFVGDNIKKDGGTASPTLSSMTPPAIQKLGKDIDKLGKAAMTFSSPPVKASPTLSSPPVKPKK